MSNLLLSLCKKSDHEQITIVALNKRVTMSDLLSSIFKKKAMWGICSWYKQIALKNEWFALYDSYFLYVFDSFYLIFPGMGIRSTVFFSKSLVFCEQKNKRVIPWEKMNNLLFFRERLWAIRSRCSWQNIDRTDLLFIRSNLLTLLLTKESGRNWLFFHKQIAPLLTKN